ncbi:hypothetical protein C8F04DRAFT_1258599 [Mycena alexandri]|uniref:CxC6 like cysteine cluster associated with KDZ domain-containing protein n=1 Tax=Mycena alexandri TaxID=1745969 RepID=A0AAD6T0I7_9AGAR|nr:hypothetical protein C8F04DRAFT_1258599 [Mycena alexandri]
MEHGCTRCTHLKRYTADLVAQGATFDENDNTVVDSPPNEENVNVGVPEADAPPGLGARPKQQPRVPGSARGYVRLAVMDGKKLPHRICAVSICEGPLVNYKNGRFRKDHLDMRSICGIIPCGRAVHSDGAVTYDDESHKGWHRKYLNRFSRLSFPGVQRVIRRQADQNEAHIPQTGPSLHSELPELNGTAGGNIVHTFRARPSFLAYDDACNLLRHIVTQNPNSSWIYSTKLIVDAWHYIGHQAADILCRIWCNPAPTNGSQPDLISVSIDDNGRTHTTRSFNTETAEQLNTWLNGYEAKLRQMSDVNYDFSVHVLMLLYKELVEKRAEKKNEDLAEEFWDKVESTDQFPM